MQIAKQVAAAAEQAATANHNHMFVLIVDDGGNLMYMERMDEAQLGSFNVALAKARSAVFFKRPTKMFEDAVIKNGYTPILSFQRRCRLKEAFLSSSTATSSARLA